MSGPRVSVVCPFYNEAAIIHQSIHLMLDNLTTLEASWELIVVDDGSIDASRAIAEAIALEDPRLHVIGYRHNRGRGNAIRAGAAVAEGEILVTTEIDSSWGDDIVHRLVAEMERHPHFDMVIASPHLPGGGFRNVPRHRVILSAVGNKIIGLGTDLRITTYTGMTRAYRIDRFRALPLDEPEKEMHLEVARKAIALGYQIGEIPALLEWKTDKLAPGARKRKSSARLQRLVRTHLLFSLIAAPFRYLVVVAVALVALSAFFMGWAIVNLLTATAPAAFLALTSLSIAVLAFVIFALSVLSHQTTAMSQELWRLRSELREATLERQAMSGIPTKRDGYRP